MIKLKSWIEGKELEFLPCPFCGGEPEILHKGNDYGRKRSITIKCKNCRCQRTDAALTHDFEWIENHVLNNWNQRQAQK